MAGTLRQRWTCSTHAGSGYGGECHRCHCVPFGVDQAVLYYYLWSAKISWRMGLLEECCGYIKCTLADVIESDWLSYVVICDPSRC